RARRLQPCCIVLDAAGKSDLAGVAQAVRRAAGPEVIIALSGAARDLPAGVDCAAASAEDIARLIRFALGQSLRTGEPVPCQGRATVALPGGQQLDLAIVDLSDEGVRVAELPGLPDEQPLRLRLCLPGARELLVRARPVRRDGENGHSTVAYQFIDLDARLRR